MKKPLRCPNLDVRLLEVEGDTRRCGAGGRRTPTHMGHLAQSSSPPEEVRLAAEAGDLRWSDTALPVSALCDAFVDGILVSGGKGVLCEIQLDCPDLLKVAVGLASVERIVLRLKELIGDAFDPDDHMIALGEHQILVYLHDRDLAEAEAWAKQRQSDLANLHPFHDIAAFEATVSIGLAGIDARSDVVRTLGRLSAAASAATSAGRGCIVRETDPDAEETVNAASMLADLPGAIAEGRLRLRAQEIVDLTKTPKGRRLFEVLLVLTSPDGEYLPAASLVDAAERYGFISSLDRWVYWLAIGFHAEDLRNHPEIALSLNVSGQTLSDPDLWPYVRELLEDAGIEADRIQFEITETSRIADLDAASQFMRSARDYGCAIALDDFGVGLSSFSYLETFEVDCVKIDGSFTEKFMRPESMSAAIIHAIISVSRAFGIKVVAERVDCTDLLAALKEAGVDAAQGFLFSRPVPLTDLFVDS